jgi:hypothetical protein
MCWVCRWGEDDSKGVHSFVVNLYESDYLLIRFQIGFNITIGLHVLRLIGGWNWFGAVSFGGRWFVILLSIFGF